MKKQAETRNQTENLPSFLDEADAAATETAQLETLTAADEAAEDTVPGDSLPADADPDAAEADADAASTAGASAEAQKPSGGHRVETGRSGTAARGGTFSMVAGGLLVFAAIGVGVAQNQGALGALGQFGVNPTTLLVVGSVLAATGAMRRRLSALQQRLDETSGLRDDGTVALQQSLQFLVEAQHASSERPPAAGEEMQHVLVALQRQDEKIANLTKAIKMYGKPLMEISGQATELAGSLAQVRTSVDTGGESTRQAFMRIEAQVRTSGAFKQEIADLHEAVRKIGAAVETLGQKTGPSLDPLQQQVARVEASVQALAHRPADGDVQKSLLRLEETTQKTREDLQKLSRGESVQAATTQLQQRLDAATTRLSDGIHQLREGNLGGLEVAVKEIQREISGVATAVAQIQAAMKAAGRAAAAPTPAAAGGATAAPAPAAPAAPAPAASNATGPAATGPAPASPAPAADGGSGATGYQTGTRSTTGKNVLGAIAKLKQMKT